MAEGQDIEKETQKCLDQGDNPEHEHSHHHHHHLHLPHVHIKKETSIILKKKEFIFCVVGGLCLVAGVVFFIIAMYSIRNCCACPGIRINPILPENQRTHVPP